MPKKKKKAPAKKNVAKTKKKKTVKKSAKSKKKVVKKVAKQKDQIIAKVDHYFDKIGVAAFKLQAPLKVGDEIWFKGAHADFVQRIDSMQMNHQAIQSAKKGQEIGIKVSQKVNEGVLLRPAKLRPAALTQS